MSAAPDVDRPAIPAAFQPYVPPALEDVNVPAYIVDRQGRICWLNAAARAITGDAVGRLFTSVIDQEESLAARQVFERNLTGAPRRDYSIDLLGPDGSETRCQISSSPLGPHGHAVGMFGLAVPRSPEERPPPLPDARLTARQREILQLLADGASTDQIAARLWLSRETVRNHVRHILRRLDARSRLEAVAIAHRAQLI